MSKGIFIPDITVEMIRKAPLEAVETLLVEGEMHDVDMPKWTPCSERLPSEKGEYLVTYHPCYWDTVKPEVRVGIDTFRGKTSWAKKKYQKVIAWKPKPMAYQGE